jgi:hypothetical protein
MIAFLWAGCTGPEPTDKAEPSPTGTTGETGDTGPTDTGTRPGPDLVATDANDLTLTVNYTLPTVEVREGFDTLVTWSGVSVDAWGEPLVASEVPRLLLLELTVPPAEAAAALARDELGFDLLSVWEADVTGQVFANLSDLRYESTAFDPAAYLLENAQRSWVVALAVPTGDRLDLRTAAILVPTPLTASSTAPLVDGAASFTWSGALDGEPLVTSSAWEQWTLDWDGLGTDALGRPFDQDVVNELFVARYTAAPEALGASLLDLPGAADAVWRMEVGGFTDARLEFAIDAGGGSFPGFTAGSTWVVGGRCSTCFTPFPAFAFTVDVR